MEELEWNYAYEDLALFRLIANAYYKKNKKYIEEQKRNYEAEHKQGFFSKIFTSGPTIKIKNLEITPSLLNELQDSISEVEKEKVHPSEFTEEFLQQRINFTLNEVSLVLKDTQLNSLLKGGFSDLSIKAEKRQESATVKCSLGSIKVIDYFTPNTKFPNIVAPVTESKLILHYIFIISY